MEITTRNQRKSSRAPASTSAAPLTCLEERQIEHVAASVLRRRPSQPPTARSEDASSRHLADCLSCRAQLETEVSCLAEIKVAQLTAQLAEKADRAALARAITQSKPLVWPLPRRWPEVEAVVAVLGKLPSGKAQEQLALLVRDMLLLPPTHTPRACEWRSFLRNQVASLWEPLERVAFSFAAGDTEGEAHACREQAAVQRVRGSLSSQRDDPSAWDRAATAIELVTPVGLEDFRRDARQAVRRFWGDQLPREIIPALEQIGWEVTTVYLVDGSGQSLEAVAASHAALGRCARHSIATTTPDIEADVFRQCRAERIVGGKMEGRYNRFQWQAGLQEKLLDRLFLPLVLPRDPRTRAIVSGGCDWVRQSDYWTPQAHPELQLQIIGTLSVARRGGTMLDEAAIAETLRFASATAAPVAYASSLLGLCDTLLGRAMTEFGAVHGSIHVGRDISSVFAPAPAQGVVHVDELGLNADVPRSGGIGAAAIERSDVVHVFGQELEECNSKLWDMGVKHTTVAPLMGIEREPIGVMYLHYNDSNQAAELGAFADELGQMLSEALTVPRSGAAEPGVLAEARTFARPSHEPQVARLRHLAELMLTLIGADHISILFNRSKGARDGRDAQRAVHAGRYVSPPPEPAFTASVEALPPPAVPIFISEWGDSAPMLAPYRRGAFVANEGVVSTAVLPLDYQGRSVGFVIVDYRGRRPFNVESELLTQFADALAAGIEIALAPGRSDAAFDWLASLEALASRVTRNQPNEVLRVGFTWGQGCWSATA